MTTSITTLNRRRRLAAVVLALPLSLAMTGSALATGGTVDAPTSGSAAAESRTAALAVPAAAGGGAAPDRAAAQSAVAQATADKAAADKAAADRAAADTAAADRAADKAAAAKAAAAAAANKAAADRAAADKAAADRAAAAKAAAAKAAGRSTPGSAAGSAAGTSAATASTGGTFVNGNTNSSKAERPTAPVPGTPSQPLSKADRNGTGANPGETCTHAYCSNGTGLPTGNGVGDGKAVGQPCAGCVGKADNKNPKGQFPNGSDRNAGYECDRNQGIGQTNPAHTGCAGGTTTPPTTPPTDACPNMPGDQPAGTTCLGGGGGGGGGGQTDGCPDMPGKQPAGTPCDVDDNVGGNDGTITICHATGSSTNPYVVITISRNGLNGHGDHEGDLIPMPAGGCPVGGTTPDTPATADEKVTICHATGNGFEMVTVSTKGLNGHGDHEGDLIPMPAGGCPAPGTTPPADVCPDMDGIQAPGTSCSIGGGGGGGGSTPLCPNGAVMPNGDPTQCPTAPPVCPTVMPVTGPVQAGCQPVPPTQGGGGTIPSTGSLPIGTVTPGQPASNPVTALPIGTVTPGLPAANPVPVGPPTGLLPNGTTPQLVAGLPTTPSRARAVPSALPFTGTDAALLIELGALLLLAGGGIAVAARRERTARAV